MKEEEVVIKEEEEVERVEIVEGERREHNRNGAEVMERRDQMELEWNSGNHTNTCSLLSQADLTDENVHAVVTARSDYVNSEATSAALDELLRDPCESDLDSIGSFSLRGFGLAGSHDPTHTGTVSDSSPAHHLTGPGQVRGAGGQTPDVVDLAQSTGCSTHSDKCSTSHNQPPTELATQHALRSECAAADTPLVADEISSHTNTVGKTISCLRAIHAP